MRHLIDTYIRAEESEKISAFDDLSLVQLIVERAATLTARVLPSGAKANPKRYMTSAHSSTYGEVCKKWPSFGKPPR